MPHAGFSVSTVDYSPTLTPDVALNGLVLSGISQLHSFCFQLYSIFTLVAFKFRLIPEWLDDSNSRVVPENVNELIFYMWVDMGFQPFTIIRGS